MTNSPGKKSEYPTSAAEIMLRHSDLYSSFLHEMPIKRLSNFSEKKEQKGTKWN